MKPRVRAACSARLAREHVVLEVGAGCPASPPSRRPATSSAGPTNGLTRSSISRELRRVEVDRAARHEHLAGGLQRAPHRLARLGLGLARDAARIDHVQLRLVLGRLGVAGGEQRPPGDHRVSLRDLAAEELDGERRHGGRTLARPPWASHASVESHTRGRRILVLLMRGFMPRCPRAGARSEEKGLMRKSSPRLWPRHHHVEEQATERHADRERVGQLGSPPFQAFVRSLDRNVEVKDAAGRAPRHRPGGQDLTPAGCPRWRGPDAAKTCIVCTAARLTVTRRACGMRDLHGALAGAERSSAGARAAAPPTRRTRAARPRRGRARRTRRRPRPPRRPAGRWRSRSPGATARAAASRDAHASSSGRQQVRRHRRAPSRPDRRAGRAARTSIAHAVDARVVDRRLDARRVVVERRRTGSQPSRAAAIASTPDPQPRSRNVDRPSRQARASARGTAAWSRARRSRTPAPDRSRSRPAPRPAAPTAAAPPAGRRARAACGTRATARSQSSAISDVLTSTSASPAAAVRSGSAGNSPGAPYTAYSTTSVADGHLLHPARRQLEQLREHDLSLLAPDANRQPEHGPAATRRTRA